MLVPDEFLTIDSSPRSSTCNAIFTDSGGDDAYLNNEDYTQTICSSTNGYSILASFTFVDIESGFDALNIYDGPIVSEDSFIFSIEGQADSSDSLIYCSDTGCLTFQFTSDGSVTPQGWEALISCQFNCAGEPDTTMVDTVVVDTSTVHIQTLRKEQLLIYPNPFNDFLLLSRWDPGMEYTIYNLSGKIIQAGRLEEGQINVSDGLSQGSYVLVIRKDDEIYGEIIFKE